MAETYTELQPRFDYGRYLPFVHLFRSFRLAIDVRKLLLASVALFALSAGDWAFRRLPSAPTESYHPETPAARWPWERPLPVHPAENLPDAGRAVEIVTNYQPVLAPFRTIVDPIVVLFRYGGSWPVAALAWTRLLWALMVWALLGGAICRIAAVQFARDTTPGLLTSVRFSGRWFLSYVSAPLMALAFIGCLWLFCLAGGLVGRIPFVGEVVAGSLYGVALLLAFVMALIVIVLVAGLPLMYAAISTEGSDAFDGFSRSLSFIFSRPWHFVWLATVAVVYGAVLFFFVANLARLVMLLAAWSVGAAMGPDRVAALLAAGPSPAALPPPSELAQVSAAGSALAAFWLEMLLLLVHGFVASYFWTAATIMYFLLRRSDDATELDEVYLLEEEEPDELLPLVGVAASDQPAIERPLQPTEENADDRNAEDSSPAGQAAPAGEFSSGNPTPGGGSEGSKEARPHLP